MAARLWQMVSTVSDVVENVCNGCVGEWLTDLNEGLGPDDQHTLEDFDKVRPKGYLECHVCNEGYVNGHPYYTQDDLDAMGIEDTPCLEPNPFDGHSYPDGY